MPEARTAMPLRTRRGCGGPPSWLLILVAGATWLALAAPYLALMIGEAGRG